MSLVLAPLPTPPGAPAEAAGLKPEGRLLFFGIREHGIPGLPAAGPPVDRVWGLFRWRLPSGTGRHELG